MLRAVVCGRPARPSAGRRGHLALDRVADVRRGTVHPQQLDAVGHVQPAGLSEPVGARLS